MQFEWDLEKAKPTKVPTEYRSSKRLRYSTTITHPQYPIPTTRKMKADLIFGISKGGKYLVVSYTERGDRIRLISARSMTPRERKAYEQ
jgi:uncharacterized DUF497 family protein